MNIMRKNLLEGRFVFSINQQKLFHHQDENQLLLQGGGREGCPFTTKILSDRLIRFVESGVEKKYPHILGRVYY
jgi:hypothetical protein